MRRKRIRFDALPPAPTVESWPYARFTEKATRPFCELCGPFRSEYLRRLPDDNYGPRYRCHKCENE